MDSDTSNRRTGGQVPHSNDAESSNAVTCDGDACRSAGDTCDACEACSVRGMCGVRGVRDVCAVPGVRGVVCTADCPPDHAVSLILPSWEANMLRCFDYTALTRSRGIHSILRHLAAQNRNDIPRRTHRHGMSGLGR